MYLYTSLLKSDIQYKTETNTDNKLSKLALYSRNGLIDCVQRNNLVWGSSAVIYWTEQLLHCGWSRCNGLWNNCMKDSAAIKHQITVVKGAGIGIDVSVLAAKNVILLPFNEPHETDSLKVTHKKFLRGKGWKCIRPSWLSCDHVTAYMSLWLPDWI